MKMPSDITLSDSLSIRIAVRSYEIKSFVFEQSVPETCFFRSLDCALLNSFTGMSRIDDSNVRVEMATDNYGGMGYQLMKTNGTWMVVDSFDILY